jgi:hypothetical protein
MQLMLGLVFLVGTVAAGLLVIQLVFKIFTLISSGIDRLPDGRKKTYRLPGVVLEVQDGPSEDDDIREIVPLFAESLANTPARWREEYWNFRRKSWVGSSDGNTTGTVRLTCDQLGMQVVLKDDVGFESMITRPFRLAINDAERRLIEKARIDGLMLRTHNALAGIEDPDVGSPVDQPRKQPVDGEKSSPTAGP